MKPLWLILLFVIRIENFLDAKGTVIERLLSSHQGSDLENLSKLLVNITENEGENLLADDISTIVSTLERNFTVPNDKMIQQKVQENYLATISNLMLANRDQLAASQSGNNTSTRLLSLLNGFMKGINSSTPRAFFKHETFALLIIDVHKNTFTGITFTVTLTHQDVDIGASKQEYHGNGRSFNVELATHFHHMIPTRSITVTLPPFESDFSRSKMYGSPMQRFSFCVFIQDKLFMPFNMTNKNLSSVIVGIGINSTLIASSRESIIIEFVIPKKTSLHSFCCGKWDPSKRIWNISIPTTAIQGPASHINCIFAVMEGYYTLLSDDSCHHSLVMPSGSAIDRLLCITLICVVIVSCACLIFLLITYLNTRELNSIEHSKILINISVCLICLYVVLLASSTTVLCFTYNEVVCGILAASCHYFILVYFGWTFVEAFFLYRSLVKVLVPTIPKFVLKAALFVWLTPLIIVAFASSVGFKDSYMHRCFTPTGMAFWIGLLLPVILINIFNWIVFVSIMASQCKRHTTDSKSDKNEGIRFFKRQLLIACGLITVTLLVGFGCGFELAGMLTKLVSQHMVDTILNFVFFVFFAAQGPLLLFFHGCRNPKARQRWKHWFTIEATEDTSYQSKK